MVKITVIVKPNAKTNSCQPDLDARTFHVSLTAPPRHNQANRALIKVLSQYFHLPASSIIILKGHKNKHKLIWLPLQL